MTRIPVGIETTSDYREATWDAWSRLRRVSKTSSSGSSSGVTLDVWYDYDGLTRRTRKRIVTGPNQGTVSYYYNSNWKCLEEYEGGSTPVKRFVYGARGRNDLVLRQRDTNSNGTLDEILYSLSDAMGSVTLIVDDAGIEKQRYRYQAFGSSEVLNPDFTDWTSGTDYDLETRFHGEVRDGETGYYNYGYRYYLPELGRWPSRDPIEESGGVNIYAMVSNDLLNRFDYLGLEEKFVAQSIENCVTDKPENVRCRAKIKEFEEKMGEGKHGKMIDGAYTALKEKKCPIKYCCSCCPDRTMGGGYLPHTKVITLCENNFAKADDKVYDEDVRRVWAHELIHAVQYCYSSGKIKKIETGIDGGCITKTCLEIQTYYHVECAHWGNNAKKREDCVREGAWNSAKPFCENNRKKYDAVFKDKYQNCVKNTVKDPFKIRV